MDSNRIMAYVRTLFIYRKGQSFYRLSESTPISHPGLECSSWIESDVSSTTSPVNSSEVTQCPPNLQQKTDAFVTFTAAGIPSSLTCYGKRSALSSTSTDPRTVRCCYDNTNQGLIVDHALANGFNTYMYKLHLN